MKFRYASIALATLVVAACDGGSTITTRAANQAPTISAIADRSGSANETSQAISFTVNDEQLAALSFSLMSDNTDVVPLDGLELGGSGSNRSLTVTPLADTLGDAYVTIIVTDGAGLSASATFLFTVDPQQKSMQQYTRDMFDAAADEEPDLVNALEFNQDAEDDDFADLLAQ